MRYLPIIFLLMATPCFAVLTKTYTVCESGGGCDYTTVQAAETAHEQDLVANDSALTFEIQNTWASADGRTTVSGWTADATRFLTITAVGAAKASATFSTTAYRAESALDVISLTEDYTVWDGLQVNLTTTNADSRNAITITGLNNTVKNCFIKGATGSNIDGVIGVNSLNTALVVRNNVIIDFPNEGVRLRSLSADGAKLDNNTIENCGVGINDAFSVEITARNNIIWNCTTPLSGDFRDGSQENYTDAGSLSYGSCGSCGTGDQVSQSDPFENLGGENYLLAAGATAIDAGQDLSGDFTDAIGDKTRDANFDKGADEFIPATGQKVMIRK